MNDYANAFAQLNEGPNMLQTAQEAQKMEAQGLANAAARQQLEARQAIGPIMQNSVDPKTGEVDYNKLILGVSANPATAWMAPDLIDKAVSHQLTQREAVLKNLDIHQKQQASIYDAVSGLLPKGEALRQEDLKSAAGELYKNGVIDKDHYVNFVMGLPQDGAPLYTYAKSLALRAQGAAKTLETVYQQIQPQEAGDRIVLTQPDPMARTSRKVWEIDKGLPPQLVEGVDERGAPTKTPSSQAFPASSRMAPGGTAGAEAGEGQNSPPRPNVETTPVRAPWRTGLAPQDTEGWKKLAEQYDKIMEIARGSTKLEKVLDTAEDLIGEYQPRAGADIRAKIANGLSAIGVNEELVNKVANGSLPKSQVFKSIMLDLATGRMKEALEGGGRFTNSEFGAYTTSKPNENMTPEAVRDLIQFYRRNIKLDRAWVKGYNHFMEKGGSPTAFTSWWMERIDELQKMRGKKK